MEPFRSLCECPDFAVMDNFRTTSNVKKAVRHKFTQCPQTKVSRKRQGFKQNSINKPQSGPLALAGALLQPADPVRVATAHHQFGPVLVLEAHLVLAAEPLHKLSEIPQVDDG